MTRYCMTKSVFCFLAFLVFFANPDLLSDYDNPERDSERPSIRRQQIARSSCRRCGIVVSNSAERAEHEQQCLQQVIVRPQAFS